MKVVVQVPDLMEVSEMDAQYVTKAASYNEGTAGADPKFWERQDQARAILAEADGIDHIVAALDTQPLSYIGYLLGQAQIAWEGQAFRVEDAGEDATVLQERSDLLASMRERIYAL